ncbi:MAG: hypothetical protein K9L64_03360 [Candidatus Izimaplasma sp.]|nr:hypothetical protein [Candidatus Izimaplasma bacterium]
MVYREWEDIAKEQATPARLLKNHIQLNRVNHAYIFEGEKGTKKGEIAHFFAKTLLCKNLDQDLNPCNVCKDCKRVNNDTHPNVLKIEPDGKFIKKEQVQNLIEEYSKTSLEVSPRINIIYEADKFNLSSANSLLKIMEEPGEDIYQILITENYNSLLPTIKSRAEAIHFKELDRNLIRQELKKQGIKSSYAHPISQYTSNLEAAKAIADDEEMIEIIDLVIDVYKALLTDNQSAIITFLEKNKKILVDNDKANFFIELMIIFQKDILQTKLDKEDLCFLDQKSIINKLADKIDISYAEKALKNMLELSIRTKYNINLKLALNKLLMNLERGYKHATYSSRDSI